MRSAVPCSVRVYSVRSWITVLLTMLLPCLTVVLTICLRVTSMVMVILAPFSVLTEAVSQFPLTSSVGEKVTLRAR